METESDIAPEDPNNDNNSKSQRDKIVPEWSVAADDQIVLVAFVFLVIFLLALGWNQWRSGDGSLNPAVALAEVGGEGIDLSEVEADYAINARADGSVAVLTGTVDSDADRIAAGAAAAAVAGVTRVDNRLRITTTETTELPSTTTTEAPATTSTTEAAVGPADATVAATDDAIILEGTVPSEAAAEDLRAAAAASYSPDQITDHLTVLDGAEPYTLTVSGTLGSQEAVDSLSGALAGAGATTTVDNLEADAGSGVAEELNAIYALNPILFESGTDVIIAESLPTVENVAKILVINPDVKLEVGGHTDSRGDDAANMALSQARAEAVVAALKEREVVNDLVPVGYGETNLLVNPDDTPEQQQQNRRIEFKQLD